MQNKEAILTPLINALDLDEACVKLLETNEEVNLLNITNIEQIYQWIADVGKALDVEKRAEALVEELEERINIVIHKLKFIEEGQKPKVLVVEHNALDDDGKGYLRSIIETAGGKPYKPELGDTNPGLIVFLTKEKGMYELLGELPVTLEQVEWKNTDAVKNNKIFLVDGAKHLKGNLMQIADDVELLAEILYPQYFVYGGSGESWLKFELQ
ncbi:iron complex transport system substrate-binding protein [Olivibacter domesticus]|uniref:Iron complex transport system substrate-binding protein n=2 Tax=Olivibacter domesticus TaxID=407022 RepID=A0A1H7XUD1_OLID1|nr:iron complex transport system substrate-binding protein [Olivibacter domesticus]